ncbi:MAG: hypothetical protein H7Y43_01265 [Akkermansiaceae bacterium]|nr:hypothetical protein [Verrucomicrobiales bacterium]
MITEWNIQSRGHGCEACGKSFSDKEAYHTVLFDEKADFRRSDFCVTCWQEKFSDSRSREGFISCWHGVYAAPPPPHEAIKKETAETLLRKLIELNDPQYMPAGYILAVMLERKRLLKVKEQIVRDGKRIFIYEQPKTGDIFTIPDPDLHLDQLQQVQRDVAALLEHGFNSPAPAAAAVETPAPVGNAAADGSEPPATTEEPVVETKAD